MKNGKKAKATAQVETDDDVLGIRADKFMEFCSGLTLTSEMDREQMQKQIKKWMKKSKLSACAHVVKYGSKYESLLPCVGPATALLVWSAPIKLREVVDALASCSNDEYVWCDLFSTSQTDENSKPLSWWQHTFLDLIKKIGKVMLTIRADEPVKVTSATAVFELYAGITTGSKFDVVVSDDVRMALLESLCDDYRACIEVITQVKTGHCVALNDEDEENIANVIEDGGGFDKVDAMVADKLKKWIKELIRQEASSCGDRAAEADYKHVLGDMSREDGDLEQAEQCLRDAKETRAELFGEDGEQTLSSMQLLGLVYSAQGRNELAEETLRGCLEHQRTALGEDAEATKETEKSVSRVLSELAQESMEDEDYDKAEQYYNDIIVFLREDLGEPETHPDLLLAQYNLGLVYSAQGRNEPAEVTLRGCLEHQRAALGEDAAATKETEKSVRRVLHTLALESMREGDHDKAERCYTDILSYMRADLGDTHRDVLLAQNNLGVVKAQQQKWKEALKVLDDCFQKQVKALGAEHRDTKQTERWLRKAQDGVGKLKQSRSIRISQEKLGGKPSREKEKDANKGDGRPGSALSEISIGAPSSGCCTVQ